MGNEESMDGMSPEQYEGMMNDFYQHLSDKCNEGIRKISELYANDSSKHTGKDFAKEMKLISKIKSWKEKLDNPSTRLTMDGAFEYIHDLIDYLESDDKPITVESMIEDAKNKSGSEQSEG